MSTSESAKKNDGKTADGELVNGRWTPRDGSDFHKTMRHEANWRYQRDDCLHDVECELEVNLHGPDGNVTGYGFADLVIDNKHVIDYKTDQMDGWTEARARSMGHEYGKTVASYAHSPQMDEDAKGHLYMVGNRYREAKLESVFREAAAEHGVTVVFCDSGDPNTILTQIEDRFMPLEKSRKVDNDLTEMVSASTNTHASPSGPDWRSLQLDRHDSLLNLKTELSQRLDQTFASMEAHDPSVETPHAPMTGTEESPWMMAVFAYKAMESRIKNTDVVQRMSERFDEWKLDREVAGIKVVANEKPTDIGEETMKASEVTTVRPDLDPTPRMVSAPELTPEPRMKMDFDPGNENEL